MLLGKKYKGLNIFTLPFFPLILFATNALRVLKTYYSCTIFFKEDWRNFNRFRPRNGINSLFYLTQAVNLERYGRYGISPYVGTGNYQLSNWWHLSWFSIYLTKKLGVVLPVLFMFGFLLSHLLWISHANVEFEALIIALVLAFTSSYFYGGSFVFLNYNVVGWLFMPVGIFALITGDYVMAGIAWFLVAQGSITAVFIAFFLCLGMSINHLSYMPLLSVSPAIMKCIFPLFFVDSIRKSVSSIACAIGLKKSQAKVKYRYNKNLELFSFYSIYFITTWSVFTAMIFLNENYDYFVLSITVIILWIVNSSFARFADPQSIYMAMFSVGLGASILIQDPWLFVTFWVCVSPPPFLIGAGTTEKIFRSPSLKPFRISNLIKSTKDFFKMLPQDSRVLLVLNDPGHEYSRIFDGYRVILELFFYVGNLRKLLVFPDWWAIFSHNSSDSSSFWGRSPEQAIANLKLWNGNHVLVYQKTATKLDSQWVEAGFREISTMDWSQIFENELGRESLWGEQPIPKWFLLKPPPKLNEI